MKLYLRFLLIFLCTTSIFAGGTDYNPFAGSKTLALNGMYFAGSDNAFSMNPSTITDLDGLSFNFSLIDKIGQQEFLSPTTGLHRSYSEDNYNFSGGINWKYKNLGLALTYYPLVDYYVSWPFVILKERNNNKVVRAFDMLSALQVNCISPTAAYDLGLLKIGLSANIYLMNFKTDFAMTNDQWFAGTGELGYQFRYEEDGIGYGASLGAAFQLNDKVRIGAVVRTPFSVDLSGTGKSTMMAELDSAATEVDLGGKFEMPLMAGAGILINFTPSLYVNADLSYQLWGSTQKTFDYEIQNTDWLNRLSSADPTTGMNAQKLSFNAENTFSAGLGLEYFPGGSMFFRAGYRYSKSPYASDAYNMLFSGVDTHNFSLGAGYFEENYTIDFTLLYSAGINKQVNNLALPVNSGNYDSMTVVPALTLIYKF